MYYAMKIAFSTIAVLLIPRCATALSLTQGEDFLLRAPSVKQLEDELLNILGESAPPSNSSVGSDASDANVDKLAHGLARLQSAGKATPEMMGFVKTVNNLITKDMMPKVIAGHNKSVDTLATLMEAFSKCKGAKLSAMAAEKKKKALGWKISRSHRQVCRKQEQGHWKLKYDCSRLVASKLRLYKSDCSRQEGLKKSPSSEAKVCHPSKGREPYGGWLERNYEYFKKTESIYLAAKKACDTSRADYEEEKPKCDIRIKNWEKKRGVCNGKQDALEGTFCSLAKGMQKSCTEHRTCYRMAMRNLGKQEPKIRSMVKDRKAEWRALKRIGCLLGVFSSEDGGVDTKVIDACKNTVHSTSHLDIKFPRVPPRIRCLPLPATPCSTPFLLRHYKGISKTAKPKSCNQCVLKTRGLGSEPTHWLKAENYIPKTNVWQNDGTGGDVMNLAVSGKARLNLDSGSGAKNRMVAVTGSHSTVLNFGNIIPTVYTICSLTRYTSSNGHYRKRILNGNGRNWLHGHWMGRAGAVYYSGWKAGWYRSYVNPNTNWAAVCAKNRGRRPHNVIVNGRSIGKREGGYNPPRGMMVNAGVYGNEKSDFAIAELMVWDSPLTDYHMRKAMNYLLGKMRQKVSKSEMIRRIQIVKQDVKPVYWLKPEKWDPMTGIFKNMGTGKSTVGNIVSYGKVGMVLEAGYGSAARILSIKGDIYTRLDFGNIVPTRYTICSLTRYTSMNTHRRKRILNGAGINWLHGHWFGRQGAVYYAGWKAGWDWRRYGATARNVNWQAICTTNDGPAPTNVVLNGRAIGIHQGGRSPRALQVNQGVCGGEKSDYAIAEIKIWDHGLSRYHQELEMNKLLRSMRRNPSPRQSEKMYKLVVQSRAKESKR